jgi:pimeloyl-ACP methyl ester carboxylesterase
MEEINIRVAADQPSADNGVVRVRRIGDGDPLVFSHGAGFASDCFRDLTGRMSASFSVYLFDLPGHGVNPQIAEAIFSLELALACMGAVCDEVARRHDGLAPALVCHSISSVVALRLRAETPARLSALVAYEPPLAQPDANAEISIVDQSVLERRALGRKRTFDRVEDLAARYARREGGPGLSQSAAAIVAAGLLRPAAGGCFELRCAPEVEAKIYRTNQHFGLWPRLRDPGPSVTIMAGRRHGASDYTADVAPQIAEVGSFDLITLAGLSHLGWAEAPERVAPYIAAALGK